MERWFNEMIGRPWGKLALPDWWRRRELIPRQPAIEITDDKDTVIIKAEIPGLKKENLQVNLSDSLLTIGGERKQEQEKKGQGFYYSERSYGNFSRSIQLPSDVLADQASANFKDGILEVRLPKTEEAKRKAVKIKVE
jgi:HSP20 family protein